MSYQSYSHASSHSYNTCFLPPQSGPDERCIPGNTIAVQADMPYSGLSSFGTAFLSKFECSQMPHPVQSLIPHPVFIIRLAVGETNTTSFFVKAVRARDLRGHSRSFIRGEAADAAQLRFHRSHVVVCGQVRPHPSPV